LFSAIKLYPGITSSVNNIVIIVIIIFMKGDLKLETEALLCAAQEQALRTNYVKHYIDKTVNTPLCRMCGKKRETVHRERV